jgi:hypothetical protein
MDDKPSLLCLGHSPELLKAMESIISSPENLAQHQSVLRGAFRRALSEAERMPKEWRVKD